MSIAKFTPPSDMERVLQVHVNQAEFNAIMENKISVVFVSYDSELKKSIVLDERRTASGEKSICLGSTITYSFGTRTPHPREYSEDGGALA